MGRPPKAKLQKAQIEDMWFRGITATVIAERLGISRASVFRYAPLPPRSCYLRAISAEANRLIAAERRRIGSKQFRKGFPELLEDYKLDRLSDEEKIDEAVSLICADSEGWTKFKQDAMARCGARDYNEAFGADKELTETAEDKERAHNDVKEQLRKSTVRKRDFSKLKF